jgi:general secretion pathway protein F
MAAYEYVAMDAAGKRATGVITADTPRAARRELRLRQLLAVDLNPISDTGPQASRAFGRITSHQRVMLMRQLAVLLKSGMPVEQALSAAADNESAPSVQRVLHAVRSEVTSGARLADAMKVAPSAFSPLVRSVTAAGEMSGRLGEVTERLATNLERSYRLSRKVQAALIYPALLGLMALGMVVALMLVIVPKLVEQFELFEANLPLVTRIVISLSNALRHDGLIILVVLGAGLGLLVQVLRTPKLTLQRDGLMLRLPLVGRLLRTVAAARFARVFAILAGSGATMLDALSGAKGAAGNAVFAAAADQIAERVREGGSFAAALRATKVFPQMMVHMVASGEAGRDVSGMMGRAADFLDEEFETGSATLLALIEPIIIVVLGAVVGLVVISIMLPVLQLNTLAVS